MARAPATRWRDAAKWSAAEEAARRRPRESSAMNVPSGRGRPRRGPESITANRRTGIGPRASRWVAGGGRRRGTRAAAARARRRRGALDRAPRGEQSSGSSGGDGAKPYRRAQWRPPAERARITCCTQAAYPGKPESGALRCRHHRVESSRGARRRQPTENYRLERSLRTSRASEVAVADSGRAAESERAPASR